MTRATINTSDQARIAIHCHVFYANLWTELKQCIQNIVNIGGNDSVDVFITCPDNNGELYNLLLQDTHWPRTKVMLTANCGYDVGPFIIEFLDKINLSDYQYVVKLHTKRNVNFWLNFHFFRNGEWREALLSFCNTESAFRRSLSAMANSPKIGMIASSELINYACSDLPMDIPNHVKALQTLGLKMNRPVTVCGTMFMVRSSLLKPFHHRYTANDFILEGNGTSHQNYGLAGKLEYHIPMAISAQGYIICEGKHPWWMAYAGYMIEATIFRTLRTCAYLAEKALGTNNILKLHRMFEK